MAHRCALTVSPLRHRHFDRYVVGEVWPAFVAGFALFLLAMLAGQLIKLSDASLTASVGQLGFGTALEALCFALPPLVGVLLPMAWLFACLFAFSRLSEERELLALSQTGASPRHLYRVPLCGGLLVAVLAAFALVVGEPWGARRLRTLFADRARRAVADNLQPKTFYTWVPDVTVMVEDKRGDQLYGVLLADRRDPDRPIVIDARQGRISVHSDGQNASIVFALRDGAGLFAGDGDDSRTLRFATGHYRLDLNDMLRKQRLSITSAQEKSFADLWRAKGLRRTADADAALDSVTLQRKFAFPLAAVIFAAVAVGLGARVTRGARGKSVFASAVLVAGYYSLGRTLELLARSGQLSPVAAAWLPNMAGVVTAVLLARFRVWRVP